jgi:1-aminocyclopropane-1-carboxylate deaminase
LEKFEVPISCAWDLWPDFHFGGFGRFNAALIEYMTSFSSSTGIPLDPVYTGKVVFAVDQKMREQYFKSADKVMVIHTGGLQGLKGYRYRFPDQWTAYADTYGDASI